MADGPLEAGMAWVDAADVGSTTPNPQDPTPVEGRESPTRLERLVDGRVEEWRQRGPTSTQPSRSEAPDGPADARPPRASRRQPDGKWDLRVSTSSVADDHSPASRRTRAASPEAPGPRSVRASSEGTGVAGSRARSQSSPKAASAVTSYVNRVLGGSSPFSEHRRARNRLIKFRASLQAELSRALTQVVRAKRSLATFEQQSRAEEGQLVRVGMRRHVQLQNYYTSVKRTLLQLEVEQAKHVARVIETRENEIALLIENIRDVLGDDGELDEAFLQPPSEMIAKDAIIVSLQKRMHWLGKACTQVRREVARQTGRKVLTPGVESVHERRRKLLHLLEECRVLYFSDVRWDGGNTMGFWLGYQGPFSSPSTDASSSTTTSTISTPSSSSSSSAAAAASGGGSGTGGGGGGGGSAFAWNTVAGPSHKGATDLRKPKSARQRDMVKLRMKYEREFAYMMEDERFREGRLLRRWFELLDGKRTDVPFPPPISANGSGNRRGSVADKLLSDMALSSSFGLRAAVLGGAGWGVNESLQQQQQMQQQQQSQHAAQQVHAPRSITAFINYFAVKRVKEPYGLPDAMQPTIVALVQSLVFRRARRVTLGYMQEPSVMKALNRTWRTTVRRARQLSARAIGVPDAYLPVRQREPVRDISSPRTRRDSDGGGGGDDDGEDAVEFLPAEPVELIPPSHPSVRPRSDGELSHDAPTSTSNDMSSGNDPTRARGDGVSASASETEGVETSSMGPTYTDSSSVCEGAGGGLEGGDAVKRPYQDTSDALSEMTVCLTPQEMSDSLMSAMRCLHYDAVVTSGIAKPLDADTMFPILLYAIVQADLPDIHACLYCLRHFAAGDHAGEKAYYITTLEAAVQHLESMDLPPLDDSDAAGVRDGGWESESDSGDRDTRRSAGAEGTGGEAGEESRSSSSEWSAGRDEELLGPSREEQARATQFLEQWLGVEAAMEDTIDVLERDGWW